MKKPRVRLTQESLLGSLLAALEFGFKCREKNLNLSATIGAASPVFHDLIEQSGLEREIFRIKTKKESE